MAREKPVTPYQRLLEAARKFASAVEHRHARLTLSFNKDSIELRHPFRLDDVLQRAIAAQQLGYTTELRVTDNKLEVWLVKRVPDRPYELN